MQVFSLVISLITIGTVVVTVNSKLLGGKVSVVWHAIGCKLISRSFFQSLVRASESFPPTSMLMPVRFRICARSHTTRLGRFYARAQSVRPNTGVARVLGMVCVG
jgi:hypothetical protein